MINSEKLSAELKNLSIRHNGVNSNGIVWDDDNNEIQDRPDVAAIIAAHDPTPEPKAESVSEQIEALKKRIKSLEEKDKKQ